MIKQSVNAGVHAATGFEFQKHCALYLLIENWEEHKDKKYFICIEHHDDILFCYQEENELIEYIKTFQAKKASKPWGMTKKFHEILQKILQVGKDLRTELTDKSPKYTTSYLF